MLELLTAQEAADLLKLKDPKTAKKKLAEWGVQPYFLGKGQGAGYRYRKDEIFEALEQTRVAPFKKQKEKKRPKQSRTFVDDLVDGSMTPGEVTELLKSNENPKQ